MGQSGGRRDRRRVDGAQRERMRAIELFRDLADDELDVLDATLTEARVESGRRLTVTDGAGREFGVVLEGLASVIRDGVEVARLGPGAFFGEHALLTGQPRSADVIAITPMRLLVATPAEFSRLRTELPHVAARLLAAEAVRQPPREGAGADEPAGQS